MHQVWLPLAHTSGLILLSAVGPCELKLAISPFEDTAPTDSTESASAGAIIGVVLCLNHNFDDILEYVIDRPWHESIELDISNFLNQLLISGPPP